MLVLLAGLVAVAALVLGARRAAARRARALPAEEIAARHLLGVGVAATRAEILAAHRQLIGDLHPDHGSDSAAAGHGAELAARVNAARDLLLARPAPRT